MSIDKTPEDQAPEGQSSELDEGQLAKVAGGIIAVAIAVDPSDPSGDTYNRQYPNFYLRNTK